jgi:Asp-tRNA(Asn)/Glu-tRNA(Gln) amidotransferase B subunit
MYELPICTGGHLEILVDRRDARIGLTRIHMEEDTGKNIHDAHGDASLVDFNRCGVPLLEIVSEPDMRSVAEAGAYLRTLRSILQYLEICDGNMEEGSFRCDANVSVRPAGTSELGTKVEIKNMNSFRAVEKAITYEIAARRTPSARGERLVQETRLWDADRERDASDAEQGVRARLPLLPRARSSPLVAESPGWTRSGRRSRAAVGAARALRPRSQLSTYDADVLTQRKDVADYFEAGIAAGAPPKEMANWAMTEICGSCAKTSSTRRSRSATGRSRARRSSRSSCRLVGRTLVSTGTRRRASLRSSAARTRDPEVARRERGPRAGERPRARSRPPFRRRDPRKPRSRSRQFRAGKGASVVGFSSGRS